MTVFANLKIQPEKRRKGTYELYACFSSAKESFCHTVDMERTQNRVLPENRHKIFEYLEIQLTIENLVPIMNVGNKGTPQ